MAVPYGSHLPVATWPPVTEGSSGEAPARRRGPWVSRSGRLMIYAAGGGGIYKLGGSDVDASTTIAERTALTAPLGEGHAHIIDTGGNLYISWKSASDDAVLYVTEVE